MSNTSPRSHRSRSKTGAERENADGFGKLTQETRESLEERNSRKSNFSISIHVSMENRWLSTTYANGEWFGFDEKWGTISVATCLYLTSYVLFYKSGDGAETSKKAGLFRSPNSLFELNAGDFLLRETGKFSVSRISGTHRFWGEQRKIRVSTFRKRRKMPPILSQIRTVPCPRFGFDEICTCIYLLFRINVIKPAKKHDKCRLP